MYWIESPILETSGTLLFQAGLAYPRHRLLKASTYLHCYLKSLAGENWGVSLLALFVGHSLTLIRVAIKKSVAGRLKVIYDLHIFQWQAGFLWRVRCLCVLVCLTHRSSQRLEEFDSLAVPQTKDSGTVFEFFIFHFQVPQTGMQSETTFFVRASQRLGKVYSLCVPVRGTWKWNITNPKTVPES